MQFHAVNLAKLATGEGLTEWPTRTCDIIRDDSVTVTSGDLEWETLPIEVAVALPILAPIAWHSLPIKPRSFDIYGVNITGTAYIGYEH